MGLMANHMAKIQTHSIPQARIYSQIRSCLIIQVYRLLGLHTTSILHYEIQLTQILAQKSFLLAFWMLGSTKFLLQLLLLVPGFKM